MSNAKLDRIKAKLLDLRAAVDDVANRNKRQGVQSGGIPTADEAEGLSDIREVIEKDLSRLAKSYNKSDDEIRSFALSVCYSSKLFDENGVEPDKFPVIFDAWKALRKTALDIYDGK